MTTGIVHQVDVDTLTLATTTEGADGREYTLTMKWNTPEEMFDNLEQAKRNAVAKIKTVNSDLTSEMEPGTVNNIKKLYNGRKYMTTLYTSVGGSPWILPKFTFQGKKPEGSKHQQLFSFGAGWLKGCFIFSFSRKL